MTPISPQKALKILGEGKAHGKMLTEKQKKFFGLIASGKRPMSLNKPRKK